MSVYSITSEVVTKEKSQKFMDPGVHENVKLVNVKVETTANGNTFIAFTWHNIHGQEAVKTEWDVKTKGNVPYEELDEKGQKMFNDMKAKQMSRIIYIAKQFVPEEELIGNTFADYRSFIDFINSKLTPDVYKDIELRIKVAFDKDDWCTVPNYVKESVNPWIERMDKVSREDSKMKMEPGDRVSRNTALPGKKANPLLADTGEGMNLGTFPEDKPKDDLPF